MTLSEASASCAREVLLSSSDSPLGLEIELKYEIHSDGDHTRLIRSLAHRPTVLSTFTTYYLDTKAWELKEEGFNLRLRAPDDGKPVICVKMKSNISFDGGVKPKVRWEIESEISGRRLKRLVAGTEEVRSLNLPPMEVILKGLGYWPSKIGVKGVVKTHRTAITLRTGTVLHIDRFSIDGAEEEIEVEVELAMGQSPDNIHAEIEAVFAHAGIEAELTNRSKRSRLSE